MYFPGYPACTSDAANPYRESALKHSLPADSMKCRMSELKTRKKLVEDKRLAHHLQAQVPLLKHLKLELSKGGCITPLALQVIHLFNS